MANKQINKGQLSLSQISYIYKERGAPNTVM